MPNNKIEKICIDDLVPSEHQFRKFIGAFDFSKIKDYLDLIEKKDTYKDYGIERLFKCLLLQVIEDLEDVYLEEMLQENVTVKWFCDFSLLDRTPDIGTIAEFRNSIGVNDLSKIFTILSDQIKNKEISNLAFVFIEPHELKLRINRWEGSTSSLQIGLNVEALEEILMSDIISSDNSMMLHDMDGFLTAIAIGPEIIPPSEWLPYITGGKIPEFETEKQSNDFFNAVVSWHDNILYTLDIMPEEYEPFLQKNNDGDPIFSDWAEGFIMGMFLREKSWRAIKNSEEYGHNLVPILAHMPDPKTGGFLIGEESYQEVYEKLKNDNTLLPNSVIEIYNFWKKARRYYYGKTKVGRNDPCFCGSNKKFKKCCGAH